MRVRRALRAWALLAGAAAAAFLAALAVGSSGFSPGMLLEAFATGAPSLPADIVLGLRLPRAVAAFATGGLLALSGALLQVLLRNPLADPYVLGVSGGAAVGALGAMLAGAAAIAVDVAAAAGAAAAMLLVLAVGASRAAAGVSPDEASWRLLLAGVMVATGCGALVTLILALAPDAELRGMVFWMVGDLAGAQSPALAAAALAALLAAASADAARLNVLLRGEDAAQALGVPVRAVRRRVFLIASLATAAAVTTAGSVGFVGLVVPHVLRLALGNDQRVLLPACAIGGGTLLLVADALARSVAGPQQLPVGVATAFIGIPVFLSLLGRYRAG